MAEKIFGSLLLIGCDSPADQVAYVREFSHRDSLYYQSPATPVDTFRLPPCAGKVAQVWQALTQTDPA